MQLRLMKQIIEKNFKTSSVLSKNLSMKTTHLIVGNKQNENIFSPKIVLAALRSCKIVKFDWIMQSSHDKKWMHEQDYSLSGLSSLMSDLEDLKHDQRSLDLFSNLEGIFISIVCCKETDREHLSEIVLKCCGNLTSRPARASMIIVDKLMYRKNSQLAYELSSLKKKKNLPIISYEWIIGKESEIFLSTKFYKLFL